MSNEGLQGDPASWIEAPAAVRPLRVTPTSVGPGNEFPRVEQVGSASEVSSSPPAPTAAEQKVALAETHARLAGEEAARVEYQVQRQAIYDAISEAQAAGNWNRSAALKFELADFDRAESRREQARQDLNNPPPFNPGFVAETDRLQAEGKWEESAARKFAEAKRRGVLS